MYEYTPSEYFALVPQKAEKYFIHIGMQIRTQTHTYTQTHPPTHTYTPAEHFAFVPFLCHPRVIMSTAEDCLEPVFTDRDSLNGDNLYVKEPYCFSKEPYYFAKSPNTSVYH